MFEQKDEKKLWRRIGINNQNQNENNGPLTQSIDGRASRSSKYSSVLSQEVYQRRSGNTPQSNSMIEPQPPFAPPSMEHPHPNGMQSCTSIEDIQYRQRLHISQEESKIQEIIRLREDHSHLNSINYEDLEQYNEEISQIPESITPLVYSKNSRKDEVQFKKKTAKVIILKIRLAEAKDTLQRVRQEFLDFALKIREEHESFQKEVCSKYFQIIGQISIRVQQSVFMHKQDFQQLKYELEVIRAKEDAMNYPVDSELFVQNSPAPIVSSLKSQNQELKQQIMKLTQQKEKLVREGETFKKKITEIEAKTLQIRQSNDKLYEYIFDLQQKIAFYKEEIPKISLTVKEETEKRMEQEMEQQSTAHYEEMNRNMQQIEMLETENMKLNEEITRSNELIKNFEKQNGEVRMNLQRLDQQLSNKQQDLQAKAKELLNQQNEGKRLKNEVQRLLKEREEVDQWKEEQRRQSNSRINRGYSIKQDKKLIETLEIQKLVLQKQNIQLKATIEFYNKNQIQNQNYTPNYMPQKTYPINNFDNPPIFQNQNQQFLDQRDRQLQMKERQLLQLQNYLEDEARKIQTKQRDIESQYVTRKTQEHKFKEYVQPATTRIISHDDYGMKPINQVKSIQQRKNHFCSSEAQAIIEKVKMRQKLKENGCCNDTRNCHCQTHSRGSRTSQDSNSRDCLKLQHHRPVNYSPGMGNYQYTKRQQKSSKMKLIEQKVRRLKSQLKNSFSTMKS